MPTYRVNCPRCGKSFRFVDAQRGLVVACPHCKLHLRIPKDSSAESAREDEEESAAPGGVESLVQSPTEIDPGKCDLNALSGAEFEDLVLRLLDEMGFEVEQTARTGDGGVDIVARSGDAIMGGLFLVQCKRWTSSIGEPVIRDLYGTILHHHATKGILITNSDFTRQAVAFSDGKPIELINGARFRSLLLEHKVAGSLPEGMTIGTVPPGIKRFCRGLTEIVAPLKEVLERNSVIRMPGTRPRNIGDFCSLWGRSCLPSMMENISRIFADCFESHADRMHAESLDRPFVDSRLAMLRDITSHVLNERQLFADTRLSEQDEALKSASLDVFDSLFRQFVRFVEQDMLRPLNVEGRTVEQGLVISITFRPNLDVEIEKMTTELSRAAERYNLNGVKRPGGPG